MSATSQKSRVGYQLHLRLKKNLQKGELTFEQRDIHRRPVCSFSSLLLELSFQLHLCLLLLWGQAFAMRILRLLIDDERFFEDVDYLLRDSGKSRCRAERCTGGGGGGGRWRTTS